MKHLAWAAVIALAMLQTARAQTVELVYQAVMHVQASHAMPVLDDRTHIIGTGAFRGLAIFSDGEVAVHRYNGWFDLKDGSGAFHGHALWRFDDGSEIRASYDGTAGSATVDRVNVKARFDNLTGTGRYAGVIGDGGFEGRRIEAIDKGGSTYLNGTLQLTLPQ